MPTTALSSNHINGNTTDLTTTSPPPATAATLAAAASTTPGAGTPVLGGWLVVRRRALLSLPKRRYVVLTDDHVLLVDSTPVLHLVDCTVTPHIAQKVIDLTPLPSSGVPVRLFTDSPFQYSKWRLALQASAEASLSNFYTLQPKQLIGVGVHGIVRRAYPHVRARQTSLESSTTASEFFPSGSLNPSDSQLIEHHNDIETPLPIIPIPSPINPHQPKLSNSHQSSFSRLQYDSSLSPKQYKIENHSISPQLQLRRSTSQQSRDRPSSHINRLQDRAQPSNSEDKLQLNGMQHNPSANNLRLCSFDIDPDGTPLPDDEMNNHSPPIGAVPSSKNDKRLLKLPTYPSTDLLQQPPLLPHNLNSRPLSVAVKTISRTANGTVTVASEVLYAKARLSHFALVKVHDVFETVNEVHIVMEECLGGSLQKYVHDNGRFCEEDARQVFLPILKAVGYLHASGIVHWDVSPSNVLLTNTSPPLEPKLIDFGTARPIDPANGRVPPQFPVFAEKGKVASLACASPELLTSKAHRYAAKADMWQLGCLLFYLLVGRLPFAKKNVHDLTVSNSILQFCKKRSAERDEFLFSYDAIGDLYVSNAAKELILKLLCPNPRMRPNALRCLKEFDFFRLNRL